MFKKGEISHTLRLINRRFRKTDDAKEALLLSKLAVLELCGWIEESMDDVVERCCNRLLRDSSNIDEVKDEIIKKTYGFEYHRHFRSMLIRVIGLINVEILEASLEPSTRVQFESKLFTLKLKRNTEAHTHLKGVTMRIDAPSITIQDLSVIYRGLIDLDRELRSLKL